MVLEITQEQVNGFRMSRHFLTKPASRLDIASVVEQVCGIQAQMPAAANLQLWSRIHDLQSEDIASALWTSKSLLRTWSMRGTAHYLATSKFPAYLKAIMEPLIPRHKEWLSKRGMREFGEIVKKTPQLHDFEAILIATTKALINGPATREEVAEIVTKEVGPEARSWVDTGYYIVTKLLAYEGKVCFGPEINDRATLVLTDQWLPKQPLFSKKSAEDIILMNYLQGYGPATPQDFSAWSGLKMTTIKPIWERAVPHLAEVVLHGKRVWLRQQDLKSLLSASVEETPVRLLPHFDIFLLGHKDKSHLVEKAYYKLVFKKAAWIAPVLLFNGRAIGTWRQKRTNEKLIVFIEPFTSLTKSQIDDVESETQRLGNYFELTPEMKVMS